MCGVCLLQVFIRDAEHVDSVTASQLTFVSSEDLGVRKRLAKSNVRKSNVSGRFSPVTYHVKAFLASRNEQNVPE